MATLADAIMRGLLADRPAAGSAGRLYYATDTGALDRDSGSTWETVASAGGGSALTVQEIDGAPLDAAVTIIRVTNGKLTDNGAGDVTFDLSGSGSLPSSWMKALTDPPVLSTWAWINQGGATATDDPDGHGIFMTVPANAGTQHRILKRAAPTTPYVVTAAFVPQLFRATTNSFSLLWRESSSGKLVEVNCNISSNLPSISVAAFSSPTAYYGPYTDTPIPGPWMGSIVWLRLADDGTTRSVSYSIDGKHWVQVASHAHTDYITPNEVGWCVDASNATYGPSCKLVSWEEA